MSFKEVSDLNPDVTIALGGTNRKTGKVNPKEVEGYYLGSRKIDDKKKKDGFSYIHVFQTAAGTLGVWGKTDLDRKVLSIPVGTMTRATFDKMVPTPNGEMYKFKVAVDETNTLDVAVSATYNDATEDAYEQVDADGADTEGDEQYTAQTQALAAAERKAKLEALLKSKPKSKN